MLNNFQILKYYVIKTFHNMMGKMGFWEFLVFSNVKFFKNEG